jgi:hypothetical protein
LKKSTIKKITPKIKKINLISKHPSKFHLHLKASTTPLKISLMLSRILLYFMAMPL